MGYALEGVAYVCGVLIVGGGVYLLMLGGFPGWWRRLAWPVVNLSRGVARVQGMALVALGLSLIGLVFTNEISGSASGALVLAALVIYLVGLGLFVFSTWLSRRTAG
ncbi:MAG TPA: hypothetical protein VJT78_09425 [Candidatus Dormibacteraeota bacterium]|nr:hypothetical protein [Candidatus Dormibacteraeota bacterium]